MLSDVQHQDDAVLFLRRVVEGRLTNPLLLLGSEGVGRRYAALQATRELFCTGDKSTSCSCVDCIQVAQGTHPDLLVLAPQDGKDIGVDAARSLIETINTYPTQSALRVILIDGADRMTVPAANALLKTLEEPPATARVFLLAESSSRVLPTIRSRCGLLVFRPLPEEFVHARVQQFEKDVTKALVYARLSEGSVGRAVQYWGSGRLALRDKALSLLTFALAKDVASIFLLLDQLDKDLPLTLRFLAALAHDLLVLGVDEARVLNLDVIDALRKMRAPTATTWQALQQGLDVMLAKARTTKIQLAFHAKTLLLETFVEA